MKLVLPRSRERIIRELLDSACRRRNCVVSRIGEDLGLPDGLVSRLLRGDQGVDPRGYVRELACWLKEPRCVLLESVPREAGPAWPKPIVVLATDRVWAEQKRRGWSMEQLALRCRLSSPASLYSARRGEPVPPRLRESLQRALGLQWRHLWREELLPIDDNRREPITNAMLRLDYARRWVAAGHTAAELAAVLGCSASQAAKALKRDVTVSMEQQERLCDELAVPWERVFEPRPDMSEEARLERALAALPPMPTVPAPIPGEDVLAELPGRRGR